jgi:hypothetical protein
LVIRDVSSLPGVLVALGQPSPTQTVRALRAQFRSLLHLFGDMVYIHRGLPPPALPSKFISTWLAYVLTRSHSLGRYALALEAVPIQEDWTWMATRRSQYSGCLTWSHPESWALPLESCGRPDGAAATGKLQVASCHIGIVNVGRQKYEKH